MADPGTFNRYLSVQVPTTTKTATGAAAKTFAHSFYVYAGRVSAGMGEERMVNNRLVVPKRYEYLCNKEGEIDESMRIDDNGVTFDIISVDIMAEMFYEILVEEVL